MMNSHAHSKTYDLRLEPARQLARTHAADAQDERELPIWPLGVLAWIVVPVAFWGCIAALIFAS